MRKNILAVLMAALMLLTLFSCGESETPSDVDLETLAESLLEGGSFEDALAQIDDGTVTMLYGIDNALEQIVYIGSGATPEEIALFAFENQADAEAGFALAKMRLADQKEQFTDYNSWEMPKLEDAVVKQYGTYVVLCVSGDSRAEAILSETFGG
ncbi:MAG: DUF4358 domain-containing protein [Clostridia bacterium]|nr:DUF4358 domain-containing protein [Clostridia bacterium]